MPLETVVPALLFWPWEAGHDWPPRFLFFAGLGTGCEITKAGSTEPLRAEATMGYVEGRVLAVEKLRACALEHPKRRKGKV